MQVDFRHAPFAGQPLIIVGESLRDFAPSPKAGFNPDQIPERLGQLRVGVGVLTQSALQPLVPSFCKTLGRVNCVQWHPSRRQTGRQGSVPKQLGGKAVDGLDGGLVKLRDRLAYPASLLFSQVLGQQVFVAIAKAIPQQQLHPRADTFGQFGCGSVGEGDGHDILHPDAGLHQRHHPADQGVGLARARPGFHHEVGAEIIHYAA